MSRALIDEFQENLGEIARAKNEKKKSWNSWDSAWRLERYDSRLLIICLPIFDRIPDLFFMCYHFYS